MINNFFHMNGYGLYVWSAFVFTFINFTILYLFIKAQYIKERNKFIYKYGSLDSQKAKVARSHRTNIEILSNGQSI